MSRLTETSPGAREFHTHVQQVMETVLEANADSIQRAAKLCVQVIKDDRLIHVVGAGGHSQIPAMELFYRAGGLANISIMFPPGLGLFDGQPCLERVPGMGDATMAYHQVDPKDAVIVCNFYGMNAATIDLALAAKRTGAPVIAITGTAFARNTGADFVARHPSGKNLEDIADVVLDMHTSVDEQLVKVPGVTQAVGVATSLAACFLAQLLTIRIVELAAEAGIDAPLWMCANLPGGDDQNDRWIDKYVPRMRHLYPE